MDALTEPLDHLRDEGAYFLQREDLRLMWIRVDDALIDGALRVLADLQWSPFCRAPVILIGGAVTDQADGWEAWTRQLHAMSNHLRAAQDAAGNAVPVIAAVEGEPEPMLAFARQLKIVADAFSTVPEAVKGVLLVLAVRGFEDANDWAASLRRLVVDTPSLSSIRWIVAARSNDAARSAAVGRLGGERTLTCECFVDRARLDQEIDDLLDAMAGAPDGSSGPARAGGAHPPVLPPRHPTDPPARAPAGAAGQQVDVARPLVQAVKALRHGDLRKAIDLEQEAVSRAVEAGQPEIAAEVEIVLATTMAQALAEGHARLTPAMDVLAGAAKRAERAARPAVAAKAQLALGLLARAAADDTRAAEAFRRAAALGLEAQALAVAIEALKMGAEVASDAGVVHTAIDLWCEAIKIAESMPPEQAARTSVAECVARLRQAAGEASAAASGVPAPGGAPAATPAGAPVVAPPPTADVEGTS